MRTLGIDLGVTAQHRAVVFVDGQQRGPSIRFNSTPEDLDTLLQRAREGAAPNEPLEAFMEPTGLAWLVVCSYLVQRGVTCYLPSAQLVADLSRSLRRHAKSDRLSAEVLATLPAPVRQRLRALHLPSALYQAGQRLCRARERLMRDMTAIRVRLQDSARQFWPGLQQAVGDLLSPWMRRLWAHLQDPWALQAWEAERWHALLREVQAPAAEIPALAEALMAVVRGTVALWGTPDGAAAPHIDHALFLVEVQAELDIWETLACHHQELRERLWQLYRQEDPEQLLLSIKGVGREGAPVYLFLIGDVTRFPNVAAFRSWSGLVPRVEQSGQVDKKGLHITRAGPALIKKFAFLGANTARQYDPQLGRLYYDQMVHKGKHHNQAVCACATHLLGRIYAVLREKRPYTLRDVDDRAIEGQEARRIIATRYHVPEEVRQRSRQRDRHQRRQARVERQGRDRGRVAEAEVPSPQAARASPRTHPMPMRDARQACHQAAPEQRCGWLARRGPSSSS